MKISGAFLAACLLLTGSAAIVNAQEDKNGGAKPAQQEPKPEVSKPDDSRADKPARQEEGKPVQEDRRTQQQMKEQSNDREKQANEKKQQTEEQKRDQKENRNAQEQNRASGNSGIAANGRDRKESTQRIPDDKFRAHFGREHHFRVAQPVVVEGRPRFQSSGFWFEFVDPWPVGWSYSDDCYIDYIDGQYFLFDLLHPEVRIALVVVL